ncbi:MAG TPA: ATP-binding cassette domain-containing protein, partial [Solirubrobacteraceae bacterium]
ALDDVDLGVAAGQIHGLLGANGAGKTTLLRLLFGLIAPDAGQIRLLGRPLGGPGSAALDHVAGFVEEPTFYPYLSGRANLSLLARLDGRVPPARIDEALERVGLAQRAATRVGGYSTGMRQRLGIAAALLRAPRLLLLDEPTSGLDPGGARAVAALLRELAGEGVAVLLSSHQIGELEKVCDAYTVIRDGRVVWDGTAGELVAQAPSSAYALGTSDDARALEIAAGIPGVRAGRSARGQLAVAVQEGTLDPLVLALNDARVVVRRLELLVSPLESMFFALSGEEELHHLAPGDLAERMLARADA